MPGPIGFFDTEIDKAKGVQTLDEMSDAVSHCSFYIKDEAFISESMYARRVHTNVIQKEPQPVVNRNMIVWMSGEFYDTDKNDSLSMSDNHTKILSNLYLKDKDFGFLKNLDGIFSAVIYDRDLKKIHFLTDRNGLKFLYLTQKDGKLAWACEPKAMFSLSWFEPKIGTDAVQSFIDNTYLTGKQSWFENLQLIPPASIFTWDLSRKCFTHKETYWDWNKIKLLPSDIKSDEIVSEIGSLFKKAVGKRTSEKEKVGITLSGGLDSRAIFAAMPKFRESLHAFTYGKPGCADIEIAKKLSDLKGAVHHTIPMTSENWLEKRIESVWWTDGQMSIPHMHAVVFFPDIINYFNINMNGYLGDGLLGGTYLDKKGKLIDVINNRGRRLIHEGTRLKEILGLHNRYPFCDYELMEFMFSIPHDLIRDSKIYNKMLSNEFPAYFNNIPWGKTGFTIGTNKVEMLLKRKVMGRLRHTFYQIYNIAGGQIDRKKYHHNYSKWLRESSQFVENILKNPAAIYPEFVSRDKAFELWHAHLNGKNNFEKVSAYLTFEIYLQQVFENNYRPSPQNSLHTF